MKKTLACLICASLMLSMCACGEKNKTDNVSEISQPATQTHDEPSTVSVPAEEKIDYQKLLDKTANQYKFEGAVLATKNGEKLCELSAGYMDADSTKPIADDTLFCIGSVTKEFTAAAVMLLKEEGKLSVDDTLADYFPEYDIGRDVAIKDLLSMRSGIPDYVSAVEAYKSDDGYSEGDGIEEKMPPFEVYAEADIYNNKQAILGWIYNQPLDFAPSSSFEYSNSNYMLLAEIIETAAGMDYHTFLKERIFTPLEMTKTGFIEELRGDVNLAQPKAEWDETGYPGAAYGAGDIVSCSQDIDKWLTALRTNTLLNEGSYAEMSRPYSQVSNGFGYGFGLMTYLDGGVIHQGQISTYESFAYTNKKTGINLFAVTNNPEALFGSFGDFSFKVLEDIK